MPEIMIAFSLMTIFLISALTLSFTMQKLRKQSVDHLLRLESAISNLPSFPSSSTSSASASSTLYVETPYGNDTREIFLDPITLLSSDYDNGWGRDACNPRFSFDPNKISDGISSTTSLYAQGVDLGIGNVSTDLKVRNGIAYLTADGSTASSPDFYIINIHDPASPIIISSLNTGSGLASLEVAGHDVYAANLSTTNQLQVIDIKNRSLPTLVAKLKLPLPYASSTAPLASTIFYNKGLVYLGTQKWEGNEFSVIDISTPTSPRYLGGFKTNTLVNDIYARKGLVYIATSDIGQMRVLDAHDPSAIFEIGIFSPSGWATQQGKIISYFENKVSLGRTTGGFNVLNNHEIFLFSTTSPVIVENSHDIPGGVYGILLRPPYVYLATKSPGHEFQVWKDDFSQIVLEKALGFLPRAMDCDGETFYFATGDSRGIAVLKIN